MTEDNLEATHIITGEPCLDEDGCGSSDAMAIYFKKDEEGEEYTDAYCFSCCTKFHKGCAELDGLDLATPDGIEAYRASSKAVKKASGAWITQEQVDAVVGRTNIAAQGFRGISDETLKFYKIRTEFRDGKVFKRYYPNYIGGEPCSYQVRVVEEKIFFFMGKAGKDLDFFGQKQFKDGGGRLLIVGGQEDCAAAAQMMWNYRKRKGSTAYGRDAVVSTPSGENCVATVKNQYAWLDTFDEIVVGLDNDEAGIKAMEDMMPYLPKGKVKIAKWTHKDPNNMLIEGQETRFISDYFEAQKFVPIGISDSTKLSDGLREALLLPKFTLPDFAVVLQGIFGGGIPHKKIINFAAETSIGKTTLVNEVVYHLMFQPDCVPCVVTLELDKDEYGLTLLSRHHGRKVINMESGEDAVKWLDDPARQAKEHELFYNDDGTPRFYLVDDRSTTIESIKEKVEELVVSYGCNVVVFDPLTDLIDGQPLDVQAAMMSWQKDMKKSHDVTFLNVLHVRDEPSNSESSKDRIRFIKESDVHGSSSQVKSADANVLMSRNKYSDDQMVKNTTEVWVPKCRWSGQTGRGGYWYYDNETHQMHDRDEYVERTTQDGVQRIA